MNTNPQKKNVIPILFSNLLTHLFCVSNCLLKSYWISVSFSMLKHVKYPHIYTYTFHHNTVGCWYIYIYVYLVYNSLIALPRTYLCTLHSTRAKVPIVETIFNTHIASVNSTVFLHLLFVHYTHIGSPKAVQLYKRVGSIIAWL